MLDPETKQALRTDYEQHGVSIASLMAKYQVPQKEIKFLIQTEKWDKWQNKLKAQMQAYYETKGCSIEELARKFNCKIPDVRRWASTWRAGQATKDIQAEVLNDEMTNHKIGSLLHAKKDHIKETIKQNLSHIKIDPIILECIAEESSDELLLKAMNLQFINKQMLMAAIIAKEELLKMVKHDLHNAKGNPVIIAAAEKVAKMFADLKISLYGKEVILKVQEVKNDYTEMSTEELLEIANAPATEEQEAEEQLKELVNPTQGD
ncbi:hypothetical protein [Helicobacter suis]|uniref:hypothetical protein n=1 Tax=Helicobacter suis TaxID=104628 RepID=UPI001F07A2BF|nr:hypothetical protein [Helicobacter suis]